MGKMLILSVTSDEEQILDKIKGFLAEEPGIEIVEPPTAKHILSFPGLELHLCRRTASWQGQPLQLTHLEFFTLVYLAQHPGTDLRGCVARVPRGLRSTSSVSSAGRWGWEILSTPYSTADISLNCPLT